LAGAVRDYPASVDYPDKSQVCPHCHRVAAFDVVHRVRLDPEFSTIVAAWDKNEVEITDAGGEVRQLEVPHSRSEVCLVVFQCQGCKRSSAFHEFRIEFPREAVGDRDPITHWFAPSYPKRSPRQLPGDGVPDAVRSFYEEGGVAEAAGARRAAAAMFRGAVEAMCDAYEIPRTAKNDAGKEYQRRLQVRVDDLATKGLDSEVVKDMHEARLVGNDSVHDGLAYSAEELADIADLIEEAVHLAFVQPAERQAMRRKRLERRQSNRARN
jgi:hypothetical protein